MIMNRSFKLSFAAVSVLALGALATPAGATTRTEVAAIGMPGENVSQTLFKSHLGAVTALSDNIFWTIPLVVDQTAPFPGSVEATVVGFAPSRTHNLSCSTRIVFADGVSFSGTPLVQIPVINVTMSWDPGDVGTVPSDAAVEMDCLMGTGARVTNVAF
jgi:hypothetical protein